MAKCEEFIIVENSRGKGIDKSDPCRAVIQIWTKDGTLVAESDPCAPEYNIAKGAFVVDNQRIIQLEELLK